jgi:hypothetical protein
VDVQPGRTAEVSVAGVAAYPLADVALGRNTFPTAPRPAGMSDPAAAVDGNPATSWRPGSAQGRMVVDLGGPVDVREIRTVWTPGRVPATAVEFSTDGLAYSAAGELRRRGLTAALGVGVTARYVALAVTGGRDTDARLVSLEVVPA